MRKVGTGRIDARIAAITSTKVVTVEQRGCPARIP